MPPLFTVFTPTYNRAHTIERVYRSLCSQTDRDFEWLIVDDGSTDGTRALVERWRCDASFPIRYLWQPNAGKHTAMNRGVTEARGALFLTLDSDDACMPWALQRLRFYWFGIPDAERNRFSAITVLCQDERGHLIGTRFPESPLDSNPLEVRFRYGVTGEKWGFQRTDVLRRFPFPTTEGVSHMPEALVWNAIGAQYRTRFVNDVLRIYHCDAPSLTRGRVASQQARAMLAESRALLVEHWRYARYAPRAFWLMAARYLRASLHLHHSPRAQWAGLTWPGRALWLTAWPVGIAMYVHDLRH